MINTLINIAFWRFQIEICILSGITELVFGLQNQTIVLKSGIV